MIIRSLAPEEIKKIHPDRKLGEDYATRSNCDYVVISIGVVPELEKNDEDSIRYWIIDDEKILMPHSAYYFKIIDSSIPSAWIVNMSSQAIKFSHPKWAEFGYVEDYFDQESTEREYNQIIASIFKESIEMAHKQNIKLNLGVKEFIP